jgi:O-antigen ligase
LRSSSSYSVVAGDRAVRVAAIAVLVVVLAGGGAFVADKVAGASTQRVTSDRSRRIELTTKVFVHHPLVGVGLGSQPTASQAVSKNGGPPTLFVSHTTPLTIAAELGIVGVLLYAAVLAGAAKALLRAYRIQAALGLSLAAVFVTLFVHSLFYAGFFEDPVTWLVLGITASFLAARGTAAEPGT